MTALLKKGNIKRVGLLAAILVLLFVFFSLLPRLAPERLDTVPDNTAVPRPPSFDYLVAPIGDPPAGLLFWVAAALLLVSVVLIGWSIVHAYRRTQKEDPLAIEAEAAVQAIADGQSLGNVIIRCYLNMERVIALEHGIERGEAVTPREFETYLEGKGIPRDPILQLTTLFEKARYGNQSLNEHDEREAVNCLLPSRKPASQTSEVYNETSLALDLIIPGIGIVAGFRISEPGIFSSYIIEPVARILWLIYRTLLSVDQEIYWALLILAALILLLYMFPEYREHSIRPAYHNSMRLNDRVAEWEALLESAEESENACLELQQELENLRRSIDVLTEGNEDEEIRLLAVKRGLRQRIRAVLRSKFLSRIVPQRESHHSTELDRQVEIIVKTLEPD